MVTERNLSKGPRFDLENSAFVQLHLDKYARQADPITAYRYAQHDQHGFDGRVEKGNEKDCKKNKEDHSEPMQPFDKPSSADHPVQLVNEILVIRKTLGEAFSDGDSVLSNGAQSFFHP